MSNQDNAVTALWFDSVGIMMSDDKDRIRGKNNEMVRSIWQVKKMNGLKI